MYGEGIGEMAAGLGAEVTFVRSEWETSADTAEICRKIAEVKPKLVTMCHCDTPSGLLVSCLSVCMRVFGRCFMLRKAAA